LLVCLLLSPSTSVSPVSTIPPMLHTHLHLYVALSRRTNGRSLGRTFQKQVSRSKWNRQRGPCNATAPLQSGSQNVRSGPAGLAINRPSAELKMWPSLISEILQILGKAELQRDWREVRTVEATRGATDHHSQGQTKANSAIKPCPLVHLAIPVQVCYCHKVPVILHHDSLTSCPDSTDCT